MQNVLINGQWREANSSGSFFASNPNNRETLTEEYPVSTWKDCDEALSAAAEAFVEMRSMDREKIAIFLDTFAAQIEERADELVDMAFTETGLPKSPRLGDVELPRTTGQLRQAAAAAKSGSWALPTIDTQLNIRSVFAGLGPVVVFGPNNFPFAFNSVAGGDFAAAIASGNPVIGKANSSHPGTTRILAEQALKAAELTGMPKAIVQLLYRTGHADGEKLVSDPRIGATGYTGSRGAGLKLKSAADAAGKPIYLELSSVNPVIMLPGALTERGSELVDEYAGSCLMGTGQFCTNPGVVFIPSGTAGDAFTTGVKEKFDAAPAGTLLSEATERALAESVSFLENNGATKVTTVAEADSGKFCCPNALLVTTAENFINQPEAMQTEAFGNAALFVTYENDGQLIDAVNALEGNLTGCIYSDSGSSDDASYQKVAPHLAQKVGRMLNDKMPTGVAVSAAMNHGGPYPATGHPGHSAVGIPGTLRRFAMLQCYDNVREERLPSLLRDQSPSSDTWRLIDGSWTCESVKLTV